MISDRYGTLAARAGFAVFTAIVLLVFALCARNGALWARIVTTLVSVLTVFPQLLIFGDYEPAAVSAPSVAALVTALAALVVCRLPANGRYAKARRQRRQAPPVPFPAH